MGLLANFDSPSEQHSP